MDRAGHKLNFADKVSVVLPLFADRLIFFQGLTMEDQKYIHLLKIH